MPVSIEATPLAAVVRMTVNDPSDVPLVRAAQALRAAGYDPVPLSAHGAAEGTTNRIWFLWVHSTGGAPVDPSVTGLTFNFNPLGP